MSEAREALEVILERAGRATDGPWSRHDYGNAAAQEPETIVVHTGKFDWADLSDPEGASAVAWMGAWDSQDDRNAEFIAASRTDVPRLAAALTAVLDLADGPYTRWVGDGPEGGPAMIPAATLLAVITAALTPKENG